MTIESVLHILLERLNLPEDEAPTQAQLEEEFDKYIAELQAEEERLADLKSRYEALSDKGLIQGALSISNPDLHFAELLQAEAEVAEEKMFEMEEAYHNLLSAINQSSYLEKRQAAYSKIDNLLLEALAEQALGDSTRMVEYLALREQIKLEYPKE